MGINDDQSIDRRISRVICQAFNQMVENIENEPGLILEGEAQPVDGENTLKEIRSWLFGRRREDGYPDNSTDK